MKPAAWHSSYPKDLSPSGEYPAMPLWGFLADAAATHPDKPALAAGDLSLPYWTVLQRASAVAAFIRGRLKDRPKSGDPSPACVLLWLPNIPEFVEWYYGALIAGCIVTAATPALTPAELKAQLTDSDPVIAVTTRDAMPALREAAKGTLCYPISLSADPIQATVRGSNPVPEKQRFAAPAASDVAVLQYTSGTTASAKGAMMTHRNLVANALQNARWFGWGSDEITLAVLPLCHTWGMCCCLNSTFAVGGTLVLADQRKGFDPDATCREVERATATVLYGSATMFHRLMEGDEKTLKARKKQLRSLRHVKAGAMLSQGNLKPRWDAFCPNAPLQQGYGLTEASPESHNNPTARFKAGTVGVPIQDTEARIVDAVDASRELPVGEAGEVLLRGPQITLGYWKKPEATEAAFHDGWLKTGDIGVMDAEGYLSIVDRKKDLLKFRGFSISPNTIEEALLRHPLVREVVVVGRLDERDGEVPTAFVVLKDAGSESGAEAALKAHCEASLAQYERPRGYHFIAEIPKNHVAKPLRRVLRDRLNAKG